MFVGVRDGLSAVMTALPADKEQLLHDSYNVNSDLETVLANLTIFFFIPEVVLSHFGLMFWVIIVQ